MSDRMTNWKTERREKWILSFSYLERKNTSVWSVLHTTRLVTLLHKHTGNICLEVVAGFSFHTGKVISIIDTGRSGLLNTRETVTLALPLLMKGMERQRDIENDDGDAGSWCDVCVVSFSLSRKSPYGIGRTLLDPTCKMKSKKKER